MKELFNEFMAICFELIGYNKELHKQSNEVKASLGKYHGMQIPEFICLILFLMSFKY